MTQEIYCSIEFLDALYDNIEKPLSEFLEGDENIKDLYLFIHKIALVHINEDISEKIKINPNYKNLLKQAKQPTLAKEQFEKIYNLNIDFFHRLLTNTIFFLGEEEICRKIETNFGFLAIEKKELHLSNILFNHEAESFQKGINKDWSFLKKYKHPFNSLIISDAYILCTSASRDNLKQLLVNFLPKQLNLIKFDLTIISDRNKGLPDNIEKVAIELSDFLKKYFKYQINLTIIIKKIHDRNLITNYLICSSGYGFELIKDGKSLRDTVLTFTPIKSLNVFKSILSEYFKVIINTSEHMGAYKNVVGNRNNRLLHFIKD